MSADAGAGALERAIGRGVEMVLARQRADGSWQERGDMGPLSTALALVVLRAGGNLSDDEVQEGARWLRARQLPDGSFPGRPFASEGSLSATAACLAALSLSPGPRDAEAAERALAFVQARGGLDAVVELASGGDIAPLLLAMAGRLDAARLPVFPMPLVAVPGAVEMLARKTCFYGLTTMISASMIARKLRGEEGKRGFLRGLVAARETARCVELLTLYQNRNGSLMNVVFHTALLVAALRAAGLADADTRLASAVAWLRGRGASDGDGLFFDVYGSDVWSTASYLRVLLVAGQPRSSAAVVKAVEWLLAEQCTRPHPAPSNPTPGAPRVGGWGFQSGEDAYPDCDTSSAVLDALARALIPGESEAGLPPSLAARVCAAVASARSWLEAMQNPDGGWASFFRGHPSKRPGPIMARPMRLRLSELPLDEPAAWVRALSEGAEHLCDPSTEDVTARVLSALARSGTARQSQQARRALEFLREQQCPSGAWWGRWKVNYLPATAAVLSAFAGVGDDLLIESARRAVAWTLRCQNEDGGFGEVIESYRDPSLAGRGPSNAPLTASVLLGLVDAREGRGAAAARAAVYLVERQQQDGSWPNGDSVATLVPPDLFYVYGGAARYIPLEALARFRAGGR